MRVPKSSPVPQTPVVASIPGRMRLRHAAFLRSAVADEAASRLGSLGGVRSVRANPAAASLVVEYDAASCAEVAMRRSVLDALRPWIAVAAEAAEPSPTALARMAAGGAADAGIRPDADLPARAGRAAGPHGAAATPPRPASAGPRLRRRPVSRKRLVARYAKYGMMASLGGSLAAAAAGAKGAHIALGGVFLGFLGAHVAGYRRTLLR